MQLLKLPSSLTQLKSLRWLKVNERIEYKILSTAQPAYLHNLISVHPPGRTHSSSSLKITNRSFRYASPSLWNNLPASFRQPRSSSVTTITPSSTSSLFHSRFDTCSTNPSHHISSPTHRTTCVGLNWPSASFFLPHVNQIFHSFTQNWSRVLSTLRPWSQGWVACFKAEKLAFSRKILNYLFSSSHLSLKLV